jgi:hypothetical protein
MTWRGSFIGKFFVIFFAVMVFLECRSKMIEESVSVLFQHIRGINRADWSILIYVNGKGNEARRLKRNGTTALMNLQHMVFATKQPQEC